MSGSGCLSLGVERDAIVLATCCSPSLLHCALACRAHSHRTGLASRSLEVASGTARRFVESWSLKWWVSVVPGRTHATEFSATDATADSLGGERSSFSLSVRLRVGDTTPSSSESQVAHGSGSPPLGPGSRVDPGLAAFVHVVDNASRIATAAANCFAVDVSKSASVVSGDVAHCAASSLPALGSGSDPGLCRLATPS